MKRTYQPKKCQRSKVHCFRKRMAKSNGSKVLTRLLRLTAALLVLLAQAAGVLVTDEVGARIRARMMKKSVSPGPTSWT